MQDPESVDAPGMPVPVHQRSYRSNREHRVGGHEAVERAWDPGVESTQHCRGAVSPKVAGDVDEPFAIWARDEVGVTGRHGDPVLRNALDDNWTCQSGQLALQGHDLARKPEEFALVVLAFDGE